MFPEKDSLTFGKIPRHFSFWHLDDNVYYTYYLQVHSFMSGNLKKKENIKIEQGYDTWDNNYQGMK